MPLEMSEIRTVANEHIKRDTADGGQWTCHCEACLGMRSLVGMEKILLIRPLVREIEQLEDQIAQAKSGPERDALRAQFDTASDRLAEVMAKR